MLIMLYGKIKQPIERRAAVYSYDIIIMIQKETGGLHPLLSQSIFILLFHLYCLIVSAQSCKVSKQKKNEITD